MSPRFLVGTVDAVVAGVDDAVAVGVRGEDRLPYFVETVIIGCVGGVWGVNFLFSRRRGGSIELMGRHCFERRFPSFAKEGVRLGSSWEEVFLRRRWRMS